MQNLKLFRKRIIPDECILLKDDIILSANEDFIITKWNALKPKKDLHHGYSCYFLKEGFKVSKFYRHDGSLLYWYCDIVDYEFNREENSVIVTDLLADVIIDSAGQMKVVDLDELADALTRGLITPARMSDCLYKLNNLLTIIYRDKFERLQAPLNQLDL